MTDTLKNKKLNTVKLKKITHLLLFGCVLIFNINCISQSNKYLTKKGNIQFEASVPSFEEVKAKNNSVTAILNIENGEIAALALIKGFRFKNALMEEHFNENYIESNKFPKATFKGKLINFEKNSSINKYPIKGVLTLHGKSKNISITASLHRNDNSLTITSSFICKPEDFDIKIPKIVNNKIAKEIIITLDFQLEKVVN